MKNHQSMQEVKTELVEIAKVKLSAQEELVMAA